ncbi:MAG TPA: metalloregulator ArsR/SmtB family transcription factor [Nitrospirae bacterium]|nr:transcriptional repressor SdpR [bacterium BMS3Abin06]HDH04838.1 metalloregulator ArsR/SmtB family transcription factor [Nitrospirota bacterium]HDH12727.1 metalloregulator ArsR/SmtB family transcription factor [Nitrospirota bacterium]HDZ00036.1 metalloregulator ArsR/SmtB family transcription factor [Nitrospirota bacterium]
MKVEAESFKVLSVETRIKIIEMLKAGPLPVNTITEALGISQSAVSQHLRVLKQAGLVTDERRGYHIFYSLNKDKLDKYQQELLKVCTCGCKLAKRKQISETREALLEYKKRLEKEIKDVGKRIRDLEKAAG